MNDSPTPPPPADDAPAFSPPPPPPRPAMPSPMQPIYIQLPAKRSIWRRIGLVLLVLMLLGSILINVSLSAAVAVTAEGPYALTTLRDGQDDQRVVVYEILGGIDLQQAERFNEFARKVIDDGRVQAVVLRVVSTGGAMSSSDQINAAVRAIQAAGKKVVVSMGGWAVSGGYYVSTSADEIYAESSTITGSIGVLGIFPIMKGTFDKIGMETIVLRSTAADPYKAELNPFESPTDDAKARFRALLDSCHAKFVSVIAAGRSNLSVDEVRPLANGRIWMADEALKLGLIDQIGYLDDAIDAAARLAGLSAPRAVRYRRRPSLGERVFGGQADAASVRIDADLLDRLQRPRILAEWRPGL